MSNRLASETSPYLRQHADNPVRWWPWNADALDEARTRDLPILLSIGYSACHWCHVMAHECFENEAIAALMNRHFVNIKVDREERPDLDRIYQLAHQALTGRGGGWPLTVFLTPDDLLPFFAGTYFPPSPRHGLPGFPQVLEGVARYHREHRGEIVAQNRRLQTLLDEIAQGALAEGEPDISLLTTGLDAWSRSFDPVHGGHRGAPKFPHAGELRLWLREIDASGPTGKPDERIPHADAASILATTLDAMANRGLYDHLGGGFFRYCVDEAWTIPHFEKMLYDNVQLLPVYAEAALLLDEPAWLHVVAGTIEFLQRELRSNDGAFYCALDADSPGGEGAYYVWTPDQVHSVLPEEQADLVIAQYGLSTPPNFEGHAWHLIKNESFDIHRMDAVQLAEADAMLLTERMRRPPPARDNKILTSWNALTIAGLARTARALRAIAIRKASVAHYDEHTLHGMADRAQACADAALDYLHANAWRDGRLYADNRMRFSGYLDDHAFLLDALLEQLQQRWSARDADWAYAIADALLLHFEDTERGGFYFTAHDHESLPQRPKPWTDDALPSGNGVAARTLLALGHLYGEVRWLDAAERTIRAAAGVLEHHPQACATMLQALSEWFDPLEHIVVRTCDETTLDSWRNTLAAHASMRRRAFFVPDTVGHLPATLAAMAMGVGDRPAAYRCYKGTCSPAVHDIGDFLALYPHRANDRSGDGRNKT